MKVIWQIIDIPGKSPNHGASRNSFLNLIQLAVCLFFLVGPSQAICQSLPDLVLTSASYDPSTGLYSAVIKNQGTAATPSATAIPVSFLVDGTGRTWAGGWGPLAAGATQTVSSAAGSSGGGPYNIPGGSTHTVTAIVNRAASITESDTSNNSFSFTAGPDLVVTAVTYNGSTGIFGATIKNQGALATPSTGTIQVSFLVDGTSQTWASATNPLAAGASATVSSIAGSSGGGPYSIPAGTHTVSADVNASAAFPETDTTNNTLAQSVTLAPDMVIKTVSYNSFTGNFSSTITNNGTAPTPSGTDVNINYSVDGTYETWAGVVGPIPACTSLLLNTASKGGPYTISVGTHSILADVNPANLFAESNTTNNNFTQSVTVNAASTPLPDVIVTSLSYDTSTGLFTAVIKNRGSVATPSSTAIAVSFLVDGTGRTWASGWGPLAAGASQAVSSAPGASGGGPYTISTGTHTISAIVNRAGALSESNTTNNTLAQALTVGQTPSISSFTDSIGVNIHIHNDWGGDAYTSVPNIESALSYASLRHIRDVMHASIDVGKLQQISANNGATYDVFVNADLAADYGYISSNSSIVEAVEGFNEPENFSQTYGGHTGIAASVSGQQDLWADMQSASNTQNIIVNSMALGNPLDASGVGDISSYTNQISSHVYPAFYGTSGESTFNTMQTILSESMPIAPNHPAVITEAGWWTAPGVRGTTEAAQAKLTLSFLLDASLQGVTRSYLYELLDEHVPMPSSTTASMASVGSVFGPIQLATGLPNMAPGTTIAISHDGSNYMWGTVYSYNSCTGDTAITVTKEVGSGTYSSWSATNSEDTFGLFHFDGTNVSPKQSATALHNLATILADPNGSPGTLSGTKVFTLSGMPALGKSLVFERSDGAFIVALWRDDPIWDNNGNEITVTPATVTLSPSVAPSSMSIFDATVGTAATSTTTATSISVSLGDTPQFVLIQ
ncbi:CARDB domain-containing protein [Terriglobus sp. 2YAB30_2]|uniref:CARDB domain-containing protein n=1 Tax=Terriglobus sp. 2YAB30_2 TaxID=3233023 RepID=UPI003F9D95B6